MTWRPSKEVVTNTLFQAIDQTIGGKKTTVVESSNMCLRNTAWGLLNWDTCFGHVEVPTVYSNTHWTRRKLTHKELADALDVPATIGRKAHPKNLNA
jgi:hypothetical protein